MAIAGQAGEERKGKSGNRVDGRRNGEERKRELTVRLVRKKKKRIGKK